MQIRWAGLTLGALLALALCSTVAAQTTAAGAYPTFGANDGGQKQATAPVALISGGASGCVIGSTGCSLSITGAGAFGNVISSTKTRIANTTAYAGTQTAPVAICLFTSATACAPQTVAVSTTLTVKGALTDLSLTKSTTGATAAAFRIYAYQAAPTLTSVFDTSVYTPLLADITGGKFVGAWECSTEIVNGDNATYNCTSSSNDGHQNFTLTDGNLYFVLTTTGAYAPGSGETFYITPNYALSGQ